MIKITKKDIVWSYLSQGITIVQGFILLPFVLKKFTSEEIGVWYVFQSITVLVQLLDFGLQPTISRYVSYIFSGAQELLSTGIKEVDPSQNINYSLISSLLIAVKKAYRKLGIITIFGLLTVGTYYIYSITKDLDKNKIILAWLVYAIGISINFYYLYYSSLLIGSGKISIQNQISFITKVVYLFVCIILLYMNFGLLAISLGLIISVIVSRYLSYFAFYDKTIRENINFKDANSKIIENILFDNSKKIGVVQIGSFFITQGNTLIASKFLPLSVVGSYGLTLQVVALIGNVSAIYFRTCIPKFNMLRVRGEKHKLFSELKITMIIFFILYFIGSTLLILFGEKILALISSSSRLLPMSITTILVFIVFLETNHSNFATFITTKNEIPFVKPSLISGFLIFIFSLISVTYFDLGIYGLILSQGFVQLCYNNWKWPLEVIKDFKS